MKVKSAILVGYPNVAVLQLALGIREDNDPFLLHGDSGIALPRKVETHSSVMRTLVPDRKSLTVPKPFELRLEVERIERSLGRSLRWIKGKGFGVRGVLLLRRPKVPVEYTRILRRMKDKGFEVKSVRRPKVPTEFMCTLALVGILARKRK